MTKQNAITSADDLNEQGRKSDVLITTFIFKRKTYFKNTAVYS